MDTEDIGQMRRHQVSSPLIEFMMVPVGEDPSSQSSPTSEWGEEAGMGRGLAVILRLGCQAGTCGLVRWLKFACLSLGLSCMSQKPRCGLGGEYNVHYTSKCCCFR